MFDAQLARLFVLEAPGHQAPHSIAYPPHPFFDMLLLRISKAQPELLLATAVQWEWHTEDESNLHGSRLMQQRTSTALTQKATPYVEARVWITRANVQRP